MSCPDLDRLQALVDGRAADAADLGEHLDACAVCRVSVAEAARAAYPATALPLAAGMTFGRYRVTDQLGEGAMGVVYAAEDLQLHRRVALKVLREAVPAAGERLLGEARAMARLAHPNVVAVHEAGAVDGQVFLAMELVEGTTLTRWLAERRRSTDEILRVFGAAGRGLAAAHAAGLVHRDFKPDNVLLSADGRARVTDFGLARAVLSPAAGPSREDGAAAELGDTGAVAGTPAFMAPEQLDGERLDARSDQFSFCVSLYQALSGQRPFAGDDLPALRRAVWAGEMRPPPRGRVPARVRRVLRRGLRAAPDERFPSMAALLAELEPAPGRRRALAAVAALGGLVAALGLALRPVEAPRCQPALDRLAGVWDAPRKRALHQAMVATGSPVADDAWRRVERELDGYAAGWLAMRSQACVAARVRGEEPERLYELRLHCLDGRLDALRALGDQLAAPDREVVARAAEGAASLPPLAACADNRVLRNRVEPPGDPEVAAAVERLRRRLHEATALERGGRYRQAIEVARAVADESRPLGYPSFHAEALLALGTAQGRQGELEAAEATLTDAVFAAQAGAHDEVAAHAWIQLVHFIGYALDRHADAHRWNAYAVAALARLGDPPELESERLLWLGGVLQREGKHERAHATCRRQLDLVERTWGQAHLRYAHGLVCAVVSLYALGRDEEASRLERRACALVEERLGPSHPQSALCLNNLGVNLSLRGRHAESLEIARKALRLAEQLDDRAALPLLRTNLVDALLDLERIDEARAALAAARDLETLTSRDRVAIGELEGDLALAERDPTRALRHYREALDQLVALIGERHPDAGVTHGAIAAAMLAAGQAADALAHARRGLSIFEEAGAVDTRRGATALARLGEAELAAGLPDDAIEHLEAALAIRARLSGDPLLVAAVQAALARAMAATGRDAAATDELARRALATYRRDGRRRDEREALERWLDRRRQAARRAP